MMTNWTEPAMSATRRCGEPFGQKIEGATARVWRNEAVISAQMRQRLQLVGVIWLGWTVAGLFYIIQDAEPNTLPTSAMAFITLGEFGSDLVDLFKANCG